MMRQIYTTTVPELTYDEISAEADGLRLSFAKKLIAVGNDIEKAMEAPELDVDSMEYKVLEHINDRLAEMLSSFTSWTEQRFIAREIEG